MTSNLSISNNHVVQLKYKAYDADSGELLETAEDFCYLHGSHKDLYPRAEEALEGLKIGDSTELLLNKEDAHGERDDSLVITDNEDHFPPDARHLGAALEAHGPNDQVIAFRVIAMGDGTITVDGNHPFAGRNLRLEFEVVSIRDANEFELNAGHAFSQSEFMMSPGSLH